MMYSLQTLISNYFLCIIIYKFNFNQILDSHSSIIKQLENSFKYKKLE
jgi:hypothetical protein